MSEIAVSFEHVSKKFRRGELHDSLRDLVPALTRRLLRRATGTQLRRQEFWALDDVTFEVRRGEAFGIVGHNGAGKSTMLKLLCGIMKPTLGTLRIAGHVSGLLEIGAGFHPDLTGRENIYLNGTILGMGRREIARKFDDIVAFSEIEEFIDTPVKRYSSGMFARLGFSVAAHLEPDVVVIDEVLSVGDYLFQKKSLEKMRSLVDTGATILFVSHNLKSVSELCGRCVVLDRGKVVALGAAEGVLRQYLAQSTARSTGVTGGARISSFAVRGAQGPQLEFRSGEAAWVDVEVTAEQPVEGMAIGIGLSDESFQGLFWVTTERLGLPAISLRPGERARFTLALDLHLARGTFHFASQILRRHPHTIYDSWGHAASIVIADDRAIVGVVDLNPRPEPVRIGAASGPSLPNDSAVEARKPAG